MAEHFQKFRRFEYRENSNLVLQREGPGPLQNEPTGEPETLAGRLSARMGDRVEHAKPPKIERKRQPEEDNTSPTQPRRRKHRRVQEILQKTGMAEEAVDLQAFLDGGSAGVDAGAYVPMTEASRAAWDDFLGLIEKCLGDTPRDVLREAGEEVLRICRVDGLPDRERLAACREIVPTLSEQSFARCFQLSKTLTDFELEPGTRVTGTTVDELDHSQGVAVVWDDDENGLEAVEALLAEEEEAEEEEASDDEDDQKSEEEDHREARGAEADAERSSLSVANIGPHWLQRQLRDRGIVPSADSQKLITLEKEILAHLAHPDTSTVENRLVTLLEFEHFDFIQLLTRNQFRILFMTRLGQAQSESEQETIRREMAKTQGGQSVLEELESQQSRRNREQDFARSVQKEAAALADHAGLKKARDEDDEEVTNVEDHEEDRPPSANLNLNELSFPQDQKFIGISDVELPEGTERTGNQNYDQIDIPPTRSEVMGDTLAIKECLPEWAQSCFTSVNINRLNLIQSQVFECAFKKPQNNLLVCAPTGAGKTNVAMLAMLGVMTKYLKSDGTIDSSQFKIIYVSPMKALVAEQVAAFQKRFDPLGNIQVRELTGDINLTQRQIDETQVIVTTPEKWDIITRKAGERTYTQLVRLMIFDEIHLLHDNRGPVLETLIARAIRQSALTQKHIRLVGLSATLPNYEDVAIFMRVPRSGPDNGLFVFGKEYRPVPLKQTFIGVRAKKALKRYQVLNDVCYEKVMEYAGAKQVLVFVHSRKETARTARMLKDRAFEEETITKFFEDGSASKEILESEKSRVKDQDLQEVLPFGFGIHHAGMQRKDRKLVEDLFADRHIQVLVSTATLAWGVNLPAHTVIIKGTQIYTPEQGKWTELPPLDVVQMMGRGGRPQYDTQGHGIIITQHAQLQYYVSLTNQQLPIESQMIAQLPDVINAEIVLGTIRHRRDVVLWLANTYLFVRMLRNPSLYGVTQEMLDADRSLVQRRVDLAHAALTVLASNRLIHYDKRAGTIQTTALGRAASHYYLKNPTVAVLNKSLTPTLTDIELFRVFSLASEFSLVPVRPEEKVELQKVVERVPIPIKGQVTEAATKINVLLQVFISRLQLEGFALQADMGLVQQNAPRIMRAIFEIALRRGWASTAKLALKYAKVVDQRMWPTMTPLRQFNVVSPADIRKIERRDFSWERYYDLSAQDLGELVKNPTLGKRLHKLVHQFPKLVLDAYVQPITPSVLQFELTVSPDFEWNPKVHRSTEMFWVFIENVDGEKLLHYDQFVLTQNRMEDGVILTFTVPIDKPPSPHYFIRVISDRWVGSETVIPVSFRGLVLPAKSPPPSELLDLQPLPLSALNFPEVEKQFYATMPEFKSGVFNPIQTQVFGAIFSGNENVLICAPPSSGRTVCAELAILRLLRNDTHPLCVYLAPFAEIVQSKYHFWQKRFGDVLGLSVNKLGGDLNSDLKLLARSHIVLATPDHWDAISRRWKTRAAVKKVRLLIVDYIQLLNDPVIGSTMEVCVSRTRFIAASQNLECRIVGIGTSIDDAKDVADWLGVSKALFNFHPNVRTVPLELSIHRFEIGDRQARLLAIYQPMCHTIRRNGNKPVIVISPDRREARLAALEILLHAAAEGNPKRYLLRPVQSRLEESGIKLRERILEEALCHGVGILHEGMRQAEKDLVETLYSEGYIQIVVLTSTMSWSFHQVAHLVIIQDTELWDVKKKRWTHYSVNSMMQFLGHAGSPDHEGCHVTLFCRSSKREEFKRFVFDPMPLESNLDLKLADHLLAEIVTGTVKDRNEAIDWLTWTFAYRRLAKNPNFYGVKKNTPELILDYLSDLVETATDSLAQALCIGIKDGMELIPLNLGLVASFYYLQYTTVEIFNQSVNSKSKHLSLMTAIAAATEIEERLQVRAGEETMLRRLFEALDMTLPPGKTPDYNDPHLKARILMTAHFKRHPLSPDLQNDLAPLIVLCHRLVQGLVDVTSSNGWLTPAVAAMELSQMMVQATMVGESSLWQLPGVDQNFIEAAERKDLKEVFDLIGAEDDVRDSLFAELEWSDDKIEELAEACNRFPVIDLTFQLVHNGIPLKPADDVYQVSRDDLDELSIHVEIDRDLGGEEKPSPVVCPFFPVEKTEESWWLVAGEKEKLIGIKRLIINKEKTQAVLDIDLKLLIDGDMGDDSSRRELSLFVMCDSYLGCDQELRLKVDLV